MTQSGDLMRVLFLMDRKYPVGKDDYYTFCYLANPLLEGASCRDLGKNKLSQMKKIFDNEHGKEAIALFRMLLVDCFNDKESSEKLKPFDSCEGTGFAGKSVKPERREEYNLRKLIVSVVKELDESQLSDMATYIADSCVIICEDKDTKYKNLLLQFERAMQQNIIVPQKLDKLMEWLEVCGRDDLGTKVNQFEPKKQFLGAGDEVAGAVLPKQESIDKQGGDNGVPSNESQPSMIVAPVPGVNRMKSWKSGDSGSVDSAYDEGDVREDRSGSVGTRSSDPQSSSMGSYRVQDENSRFRSDSVEEKGPHQVAEMVSGQIKK